MPSTPPLIVEHAVRRLLAMPEAERPRALAVLHARDPALHAEVMGALWGETVHRPAPAAPSFGTGELVGGKFEVIETLGEGASGSVFRARDTTHVGADEFGAREVALKVSRVDTGHDGLNRDLLQKEGRLLRRLRHPRLPVVEALFEDRGRWVLVMEYIAGDSLQKRRRSRGAPFPLADVLPWLRDTLRVLDYLHTLHARPPQGDAAPVTGTPIYHRDLKPANLILDPHDNLYVVDLGIARSGISELTSVVPSAVGTGSPGYAAPEVDRGEGTLPQSDLYSVGMTALTLLTDDDARAFSARHRSDAVGSGAPDPLHAVLDRAELPEALREWIRTATALVPGRRFASAAEMVAALDRPGTPPPAAAAAPSPGAQGSAPRRTAVLGVLGTIAFAAVAIGAWAVWPTADMPEGGRAEVGPVDLPPAAGAETEPEIEPTATVPPAAGPGPPPLSPQTQPAAVAPAATRPPFPERRPDPPPARTGTARATILGEDGAPLPGAQVTVVGTSATATANAVGDVEVGGLAPGVHMLEVQAEGYVARRFRVEVAPGEAVTRTLHFEIEDLSLEAY